MSLGAERDEQKPQRQKQALSRGGLDCYLTIYYHRLRDIGKPPKQAARAIVQTEMEYCTNHGLLITPIGPRRRNNEPVVIKPKDWLKKKRRRKQRSG